MRLAQRAVDPVNEVYGVPDIGLAFNASNGFPKRCTPFLLARIRQIYGKFELVTFIYPCAQKSRMKSILLSEFIELRQYVNVAVPKFRHHFIIAIISQFVNTIKKVRKQYIR